jgi:hypothetical protein
MVEKVRLFAEECIYARRDEGARARTKISNCNSHKI